jgi:hypothetical protein
VPQSLTSQIGDHSARSLTDTSIRPIRKAWHWLHTVEHPVQYPWLYVRLVLGTVALNQAFLLFFLRRAPAKHRSTTAPQFPTLPPPPPIYLIALNKQHIITSRVFISGSELGRLQSNERVKFISTAKEITRGWWSGTESTEDTHNVPCQSGKVLGHLVKSKERVKLSM